MASLLKIKNNAVGRLSANLSAIDTSISLVPGEGSKFPALTGSEFFPATLIRESDGSIEIVKVTARSSDTLTITRSQETTEALNFVAGDRVELRFTAKTLTDEFARMDVDIASATSVAGSAHDAADAAQADATQALADAATADGKAGAAMPKAGGTFSGDVTLHGNATSPLHPVTKQQLDAGLSDLTGKVNTGSVTSSGLTMATAKLLGRGSAGTGAIQEIGLGSDLEIVDGVLVRKSFKVTQATLAVNTNYTFTHNLNSEDIKVSGYMTCTSADGGFSVGDRINAFGSTGSPDSYGFYWHSSSVNSIVGRFAAGFFAQLNKTTHSSAPISASKWALTLLISL